MHTSFGTLIPRSSNGPSPSLSLIVLIGCGLLHACAGTGPEPVSSPISSPSTASRSTAPRLTLEPYIFETSDGRTVDAELGRLWVRENRHADGEREIELAWVRFPTTSSRPAAPIIYLAGGPGGSGVDTARGSRFELFMAMRQVADVIAFDQRGTGLSQQLPNCSQGWIFPLSQAATQEAVGEMAEAAARRCAAEWREAGVDLNAYNTEESADDLEDLRRALGVPKISLWSISYGTHLAMSMLRRHPESIERAILAGAEGPDHTVKLPSDGQALLEGLAARIEADPSLRDVYPDFLGSVRRVLERLEREPATVQVMPPGSPSPYPMTVTPFDIRVMAAGMLRGPETLHLLPGAFKAMEAGDFSSLAAYLLWSRYGRLRAMPTAMDSASGISPERRARVEREATTTLLSDAINFPWEPIARGLEVRDLGEDFRAPLATDVPSLFISGTLDGRTPVANAEELLPGFSNATHLILEGAGHSDPLFLSSPEIETLMGRFLRGESLPRQIHLEVPTPPIAGMKPETKGEAGKD